MLRGKLFGSTSYQWFGGLICLIFVALGALSTLGPGGMLAELLYLVSVGLFAQSVSLFASLVAIQRRAALRRLDVFLFQIAGLIAAWIAASLWDASYVAGVIAHGSAAPGTEHLSWWNLHMPIQGFYLVSLLVFLGWSFVGNLTLLRAELQVRTSPLPWIAFLIFAVYYAAGFVDPGAEQSLTTPRLLVAIMVTTALAYAAILVEHKDPVLYRWLLAELGRGRIDRTLGGLQSWMTALAFLTILVVYFQLNFEPPLQEIFGFTAKLAPAVLAGYAFVLRDVGVFLYFNMGTKRGDFGAVVALAVLYLVLPAMAGGFGFSPMLALFYPNPDASTALMIAAPAFEAAAIWALALSRLRALMKPATA